MRLQRPQGVSDHMTPLHQNCTYASDRSRVRIDASHNLCLRVSKVVCCLVPQRNVIVFFVNLVKGTTILEKILNESQIITHQSKEAPNIKWRPRDFSPHHCLNFGGIDQNTVLVDKVP